MASSSVPVWHQYKGDPTVVPLGELGAEKLGFTLTHTDAFLKRFGDKSGWGTPCCHVTVVFCEKGKDGKVVSSHDVCRGFPDTVAATVDESVRRNRFTGERGSCLYVPAMTSDGARSMMLVGMGSFSSMIPYEAIAVGKSLGKAMSTMDVCEISFVLPDLAGGRQACPVADGCLSGPFATADKKRKDNSIPTGYGQHLRPEAVDPQAQDLSMMRLIEEFLFAMKKDTRFLSENKKSTDTKTDKKCDAAGCPPTCSLDKVELVCGVVLSTTLMGEGGGKEMIPKFAEGVFLTAQLASTPANYLNPCSYANITMEIAKKKGLKCVRIGGEELASRGYRSALAVARGSQYEAQLIHMTYRPANVPADKKLPIVSYVGKAVTMDTGGYNVKSAAGTIHFMKYDMAGSAAVVGCAATIADLKPQNVEVHFIYLTVENMVDSKAYRPGDVIQAANGKMIEVSNTDAEGRLTLADAMLYAQKETSPDALITVATLTGSAAEALGKNAAALFSNSLTLRELITTSGQEAGEVLWPMPIMADYASDLKSSCADFMNCPLDKSGGGSINACNFLMNFVDNTPYAHIDMAGAMMNKDGSPMGFASRSLTQTILNVHKFL